MDYTFIQDNYILIIVIAVIIIMTIIGFIADKLKFGEKKDKKIKNESLKNEPFQEEEMDNFMEPEKEVIEFNKEPESIPEMPINNEVNSVEPKEQAIPPKEDISFDMPVVEQKQEIIQEPVHQGRVEEPVETVQKINSEVENYTPEPTSTEEDLDFKLPSIDKLNKEIAEVEEDEDVWKF